MAAEGVDGQSIQGLRDAEEVRKLLRLSILLRTVRAELKLLNFDKATEPELNQVKDRLLETLRRGVSGSAGKGLDMVLRPWLKEMEAANSQELSSIFAGLLRWVEASIEKLEEVLRFGSLGFLFCQSRPYRQARWAARSATSSLGESA